MDEHDPSFIVVVRRASVGAGRMTHYALDSRQEDQESFKLKTGTVKIMPAVWMSSLISNSFVLSTISDLLQAHFGHLWP